MGDEVNMCKKNKVSNPFYTSTKMSNQLLKATQSYAKQLVQELVRERYLQQVLGELLAGQTIPP